MFRIYCILCKFKTYIGSSGRTIVTSSANYSLGSGTIQTSDITIPADSVIVTARILPTESVTLSTAANITLNVGSNSSTYNNIINGGFNPLVQDVTSVAVGKAFFSHVENGADAYLADETNIKMTLNAEVGATFTDGTVKFILEYITMS